MKNNSTYCRDSKISGREIDLGREFITLIIHLMLNSAAAAPKTSRVDEKIGRACSDRSRIDLMMVILKFAARGLGNEKH